MSAGGTFTTSETLTMLAAPVLERTLSVTRLIRALAFASGAVVLIGALLVFAWRAGVPGLSRSLVNLVDLDREMNVPALYSGLLLLIAALLAALLGSIDAELVNQRRGRRWTLIAAILAYLMLDEVFRLHERIEAPVEALLGVETLAFVWVLPAALLALVVAAFLLSFVRSLESPVRQLILVSGALYVSGALGLETLEGLVYAHLGSEDTWQNDVLVVIEEALEIGGVCCLVAGLLIALAHRCATCRVRIV